MTELMIFIAGIIVGGIVMALISRKNQKLIEKAYQEVKKKYEELNTGKGDEEPKNGKG